MPRKRKPMPVAGFMNPDGEIPVWNPKLATKHRMLMVLPFPHRKLSPNARVHHMELAKLRKAQKAAVSVAAFADKIQWEAKYGKVGDRFKDAFVQVRFVNDIKKTWDRDNIVSCLKSTFDALTQVGIWPDDDGISILPPIRLFDKVRPRVELCIHDSYDPKELLE